MSAQQPLQGAVNLNGVVLHVEIGQEDEFCKDFGATRVYAELVTSLLRKPLTREEKLNIGAVNSTPTQFGREFTEAQWLSAVNEIEAAIGKRHADFKGAA
jgi:hypothetical protein